MKILFIAPGYAGGVGGHVSRIADRLKQEGFDIELFPSTHIPIKNLKSLTFAFFGVIRAVFTKKSYDVVHAFNMPSALPMKYITAKKKVISLHGVYSEQIDMMHSSAVSSRVQARELDTLRWADKLLTNSKNVKDTYKEKLGLDFDYIYGPIDTAKLDAIPDVPKQERQIVYIGRTTIEKGMDILQDIESKINGNVIYCTDKSWQEAMEILKASSLLVVPSRIDNIPNVIKEALYLKVPIVGTDVIGISEIITDGYNGVLVPLDEPEKLADAINELLNDKQKGQKLADNGHEFVMNNFTWDVLIKKYVKFYYNLL